MFCEQSQIGPKLTKPALGRRLKLRQFEGQRSAFSVPRRSFARPTRDARNEYGSVAVSARKCARQLKAQNLDHGQAVEATLIRVEAIG